MYLLDSDTCIEFLRGNLPRAYELMRSSDPSLFGIPAAVEAELSTGAYKSERTQENLFLLERFLSPFTIVPFDSKCATAYGKLRARLEAEGMKIGPNNLLIAATALAYEAVLVTGNTREFSRMPNLEIEDWAEVAI